MFFYMHYYMLMSRSITIPGGVTMTKKDYELIARVLRDSAPVNPSNRVLMDFHLATIEAFADALATTNPRFPRERFIEAAGS